MSKHVIKTPVTLECWAQSDDGTHDGYGALLGADRELVFSSYDITQQEAEEIRDLLNARSN